MPKRALVRKSYAVWRRTGGARRDRWWQVGAWLLLLLGVATSALAAGAWHARLQAQNTASSKTRVSDLAVTVGAGLSRDTDFAASLASLVATTPDLSNPEFKQYIDGVGAEQRYPGGIGFAYFERVTQAGLPAFESQVIADPPSGVAITRYQITPPGSRSSYCLGRYAYSLPYQLGTLNYPVGIDICAPGGQFVYSNALISGSSGQFSVQLVSHSILGLAAPVYSGGVAPATAAGRQAAFSGWMTATFATASLLPSSTQQGVRTQVLYQNAGTPTIVVAASGVAPRGHVVTKDLKVDADGPWTVQVEATSTGAASSWAEAGVVLAAGLIITGVLFGFVEILAYSRRRAIRLVDQRTGELHHQALHDTLTDLPNRALIMDRAEQMLARGRRDHVATAALFLDLDGFKDVNDTYGHAAGDRLLQAVAQRITATLRARDTAGRLGGDEFVVLVEGPDAGPDMVAERLLAVLREPFVLDATQQIVVTAETSIGIALGDRDSAGDLLRDADIALYQAKKSGGNCYAIFAPEMHTAARDKVELTMELRGALAAGEFFLAYQPTFNLRDMTVTGVEALIRWRHPGRGTVSPDEFIPLAEDSGLIVAIGRWVLHTACAEAVTWQAPNRRLSVAVNVSGRQLDTDGLVDDVRLALEASGLEPGLLTIEVTETALMHNADAGVARLRALKALGVRISIDDFGTGYSSLAYLQRYPVDCVKIDRAFVAPLADEDSPDESLVAAIIAMGGALGMKTVAEGIETDGQRRKLAALGCNFGQGWLFAKAMPAGDASALLRDGLGSSIPPIAGWLSDRV
jgi:diguanylate cyclase (GGDEF)-like protein